MHEARIKSLRQDIQALHDEIFRRLPLQDIVENEILERFNLISAAIEHWAASKIIPAGRAATTPWFLDNGDPYFASLLKDGNRIVMEILGSLIHQCLHREFFGEHVYLEGLPDDYTDFLRSIQTCMTKLRESEWTRGSTTMISRSNCESANVL